MTIEEKILRIRDIFRQLEFSSLSWNDNVISAKEYNDRKENYLEAILALIKPMSRERLVEIIFNQIGGELAEQELLRQIRLSGRTVTEIEGYRGLIKGKAVLLADAILAEWEKTVGTII